MTKVSTNKADEQYLDLCRLILEKGTDKDDRTGTGTRSIFGHQMRFDLSEGFPLLTTKRLPFRIISEELLWFLSGSTDVGDLIRKDVNIWNADAYRNFKEYGGDMRYEDFKEDAETYGYDLGTIYGYNWRRIERNPDIGNGDKTDQLADVIESIRTNPDSRRHFVSAWNPTELGDAALPPCHVSFQFYVANGKLSCHMYQRSADSFLGLPFNIASYALLTHMVAQVTDLGVGDLIISIGDAHIYRNHFDQVREQLSRRPFGLPVLKLDESIADIDDFTYNHIDLLGYAPHPPIKAPLSVGLTGEKEDA